jgi:hypothetical protein
MMLMEVEEQENITHDEFLTIQKCNKLCKGIEFSLFSLSLLAVCKDQLNCA